MRQRGATADGIAASTSRAAPTWPLHSRDCADKFTTNRSSFAHARSPEIGLS